MNACLLLIKLNNWGWDDWFLMILEQLVTHLSQLIKYIILNKFRFSTLGFSVRSNKKTLPRVLCEKIFFYCLKNILL